MATQTLYPVANSVGPTQVRETEDAYLIEDVPFIRPMELAGGYVPEQSVRETAAAWDGVPATLNHPRDESGRPVAANEQPETHLGTTEDPRYDGTYVRGNIRLQKDRLDAVGGEATDIETALEAGDAIDVSSQYASVDLPPGEYDGEHRANAEQIVRPDSVAILPNRTGVCTIEDGCGINPQLAANAAVTVPMTPTQTKTGEGTVANAEATFSEGDLVKWSTSQGSPGTGRVARAVTEPGTMVEATVDGDVVATREATDEEAVYLLDNWVGPEAGFESGNVAKSASEMVGDWDDAPDEAMSANMQVPGDYRFDNPGEAVSMAQEMGFGDDGTPGDEIIHTHGDGDDTVFMPGPSHDALVEMLQEMGELEMDAAGYGGGDKMSENAVAGAFRTLREAVLGSQADDGASPEDLGGTANADGINRAELIEEIVANSPLTEAALEARCNDGLQAIHDDVMSATDEPAGSDTTGNTESTMSNDDPIEYDDLSEDAREQLLDEATAQIEANREEDQKEELATEIIANSANYDSDDREDLLETPLGVLEDLKAQVTRGGAGVPASGLSGNADAGAGGESESLEEYPDGVLN